jgi:hypothetical protein
MFDIFSQSSVGMISFLEENQANKISFLEAVDEWSQECTFNIVG